MSHKHRIGFLPLGFCMHLLHFCDVIRLKFRTPWLYHDSISTGSRLFMVFVSIQYCFLIWSRGPYKKKTGITAQHCRIKCTWACAVTPRFVFLPCFLKQKKWRSCRMRNVILHVTFRSRCYVYIIFVHITWVSVEQLLGFMYM